MLALRLARGCHQVLLALAFRLELFITSSGRVGLRRIFPYLVLDLSELLQVFLFWHLGAVRIAE